MAHFVGTFTNFEGNVLGDVCRIHTVPHSVEAKGIMSYAQNTNCLNYEKNTDKLTSFNQLLT